jgi:hypothetical protein
MLDIPTGNGLKSFREISIYIDNSMTYPHGMYIALFIGEAIAAFQGEDCEEKQYEP